MNEQSLYAHQKQHSAPDLFKESSKDIRIGREDAYGVVDQFVVDSWMAKIKPTFKRVYAHLEKVYGKGNFPVGIGKRYLAEHLAKLEKFRKSKVYIGWESLTDKELDSQIEAWQGYDNYE